MGKEYVIETDRVETTFYSIDRDNALELIGEEWNDEVKKKCEANEAILDMYMTKYAQRVKMGNEVLGIWEYFHAHDSEYGYPINLRLSAENTDKGGYRIDGTHKVLLEMSDEEDEDGK
tara:strand:- start:522 stop:875 length:354 start_codon:yes stop_codon:yes gene_type:complete